MAEPSVSGAGADHGGMDQGQTLARGRTGRVRRGRGSGQTLARGRTGRVRRGRGSGADPGPWPNRPCPAGAWIRVRPWGVAKGAVTGWGSAGRWSGAEAGAALGVEE